MAAGVSKFGGCLYFTTAALARKVERLATESWKPIGLPPSYAYLLMAVLDEPGIQPGTLATQLELQPSTISRFLDKLEAKKLVVRTVEGKTANVYPTPKAKELLPKMKGCMQEFYASYCKLIGKEESQQLAKMAMQANRKLKD